MGASWQTRGNDDVRKCDHHDHPQAARAGRARDGIDPVSVRLPDDRSCTAGEHLLLRFPASRAQLERQLGLHRKLAVVPDPLTGARGVGGQRGAAVVDDRRRR
jgi:hypothetical protein